MDFITLLQCCGLNCDSLSFQSCDWIYEHKSLTPFFKWCIEELGPLNLLKINEFYEFTVLEMLQKDGLNILNDAEACDCLSAIATSALFEPLVENDEIMLQNQLFVATFCKEYLNATCTNLGICHTELCERTSLIGSIICNADADLKHWKDHIDFDDVKINKALDSVVVSASGSLNTYSSLHSCYEHTMPFISDLCLNTYCTSEEHFTEHLVNFTKTAFFQGIAEITRHIDVGDQMFLHMSNPDLLLIRGVKDDSIFSACKELTYIQQFYPYGESRYVDAVVKEECLLAACADQEYAVDQMKDFPFPALLSAFRAKLKSFEEELAIATRDLLLLSDHVIPSQINEASSLQVVQCLRGDYDMKMSRQDYFTCNQDQVIHQLIIQKSRNEFLTMVLEIEVRYHRELCQILVTLILLLQQICFIVFHRMKLLTDLEKYMKRVDHVAMDSFDKSVCHIHEVLCASDKTMHHSLAFFATYEDIAKTVEHLSSWSPGVNLSVFVESQLFESKLCTLDDELNKCYADVVLCERKVHCDLPAQLSSPIFKTMTHLDTLLKKLEQAVIGVIKDVECRKKMANKDSLMQIQRKLFFCFFNSSIQLRQVISDLDLRLCSNLRL